MPAPIQRFSLPSRLVAMAVLCMGVGATTIQPLWAAAPVASAPDPLAFSTTQPDHLPPLAPTPIQSTAIATKREGREKRCMGAGMGAYPFTG